MMRLPRFRYVAPGSAREVVEILAGEGAEAMVVAGGTDLYPNMKRRHQTPKVVVALRKVAALRGRSPSRIGPAEILRAIERDPALAAGQPALVAAIGSISTPILRNMGTIGGNVCLDTRCTYYNQNYEWRKAIGFCLKCEGRTCWVAPSSETCLAINSSDTAPVLCAIRARLRLVGPSGEREVEACDFYRPDGIRYLARRHDELLTDVLLPEPGPWRAAYRKLRRREAFDFPVLGVGACVWFDGDVVADSRIFLGAIASAPLAATRAQEVLAGNRLTDEVITAAATEAFKIGKPMDNADLALRWRKEMIRHLVRDALEEIAGGALAEDRDIRKSKFENRNSVSLPPEEISGP